MDHFVGIDMSLESCAVCVVNQSGAVEGTGLQANVLLSEQPLTAIVKQEHSSPFTCVSLIRKSLAMPRLSSHRQPDLPT
jgi:hypothetical protein